MTTSLAASPLGEQLLFSRYGTAVSPLWRPVLNDKVAKALVRHSTIKPEAVRYQTVV